LIDATEAESESQPPLVLDLPCVWLDYVRGPEGANHPCCRLTAHIFAAGPRDESPCLKLCAYPTQQRRGRCRHMDLTNVIQTEGDPPLPRIACRAHYNYDAPGYCPSCKDYSPAE